jgi:para-aminobenzoate synthetase/4-amino-4-deoxychorismate lyase
MKRQAQPTVFLTLFWFDWMPPPISLLFDNAAGPGGAQVYFTDPVREIRADEPSAALGALHAADAAIAKGQWVAGYLSYELGAVLEPRLAPLFRADGGPLVRLFVFDGPRAAPPFAPAHGAAHVRADDAKWPRYAEAFARAHQYILDGDIYQVNLTFPLAVSIEGDAAGVYAAVRREARAGASAFLQFGDEDILSFSPETFFTVRGGTIATRPMKGTAARGLTAAQDLAAKRALRADPKERAENLMIVDLLRNDLARIAKPGSVRVTDLFTVETFPRLHTMTSGVAATMQDGVALSGIVRALFPCGSVTGAPKIRAMEIIRELESHARGPYCGAIGFAGPGFAAFNVPIRTLVLRGGRGVLPVGSGIVADSRAETEYRECLLKAQFLSRRTPEFGLIETIGWSREFGLALEQEHAARLAASAEYFGFALSSFSVAAALEIAAADVDGAAHERLRVEVQRDGGVRFSGQAIAATEPDTVWRYQIADERIQSGDPFRHHKTTVRGVYDRALADAKARGLDEALFLNERDEVAEGAISNVFLVLDGAIVTPPLSSGALNGCLRQVAVEMGVEERSVTRADLARADSVWFGNSVRGFVRGAPG